MRISFVCPRYGPEIVGGAEALVRDYAERLTARHQVTVLTTCVRDHFTWENELAAGPADVNGVRVERFPVTAPRDHEAMGRLQPAIDAGFTLPDHLAREWVMNTGYSEPLLAAIAADNATQAFVFAPYLFASTVFGARVRPDRSLIMPCLHDEAYARFAPVRETMRGAAGLIFNTEAEQHLAGSILGELPPHRVVGAGFDPPDLTTAAALRRELELPDEFIAHAGRLEAAKNFPLLAEYTVLYSRALSRRGPLKLMVMGTGDPHLPAAAEPLVHRLGFVSPRQKFAVLEAATVTATLSLNESFSYLLMESWLCGVPVLVHAECAVTREHCEAGGGGLWVHSAEGFAEAVDRLRADAGLRRVLGEAGRRYVTQRYSWPVVLDRLESALAELVA